MEMVKRENQREKGTEAMFDEAATGMRKRNVRFVVFEPPPAKSPDTELLVVA
ncbi:hypothetical protein A2U01_0102127, partial [Trifolium medium]|nr:hypothetical protein [Trifolium medium]